MTSPALRDLTERIEIDGEAVSTERFVDIYRQVGALRRDGGHGLCRRGWATDDDVRGHHRARPRCSPTPCRRCGRRRAGMGGRWDATNVNAADVCVITPIGMDHTDYLGDTLAQIAAEKVGIRSPGRGVVLLPNNRRRSRC